MVRIQIMSDLHIEQCQEVPDSLSYITPKADILVLAGDIGRIHRFTQLKSFLEDVCKKFKIVLYVPGNHEFYRVPCVPWKGMSELYQDLLVIKKGIANLFVLSRSSVVIGDVCIAGCTLWSQAMVEIPKFIVKIKGINTRIYNGLFRRDLAYIEHMISYCKKKELKLVVVTHHCPTHFVSRKAHMYKSLYTSNLDYLLDSQKVHTWICGHNHKNFDLVTPLGTHLISNQKGKPRDHVEDFSKKKVIEV